MPVKIEKTFQALPPEYVDRLYIEMVFNDLLLRKPNDNDYCSHYGKKKDAFDKEIQNCEEYRLLQQVGRNRSEYRANRGDGRIRVAILASGHVRMNHLGNTLPKKIQKEIYDAKTFSHIWMNLGMKGTEMKIGENRTTKEELVHEVAKLPSLSKIKFEDNDEFILKNNVRYKNQPVVNWSSPEVYIKSQLYSINQSYKLLEEFVQETGWIPDVVFKLRFDSYVKRFGLSELILSQMQNYPIIFNTQNGTHGHDFGGGGGEVGLNGCVICEHMYKKSLFHPHPYHHPNLLCDFYAYGNYEAMGNYCSLYSAYDELVETTTVENNKIIEKFKLDYASGKNKFQHFNEVLTRYHHSGREIIDGKWSTTECCTNVNDVMHLSHDVGAFMLYPTYPESMLRLHIRDYMVVTSKDPNIDITWRQN